MSSVYQVGCRLVRYQRLLQWFTCPPLGTIFSPADVLNNNVLLSISAFLNSNWNLWGEPETRQICRLGDMILDVYVRPEAVIDLTTDEEDPQLPQVWNGDWIILDEILDDEDMPDADAEEESEQSEVEGPGFETEESDYSTSESEDSGIEY